MKKIPDPNKMKRIQGPHVIESDLAHVKIRITTYLDKELIDVLKKMAKKHGGKYQSLLNTILRTALLGETSFEDLESRIERLEDEVLKKKTGT
jgi:predicted DNA binding CopG/RHH family protein